MGGMKATTKSDFRLNPGKWLQAAPLGEDVRIISGGDVIALRKVELESADYAWRECGVAPGEVAAHE